MAKRRYRKLDGAGWNPYHCNPEQILAGRDRSQNKPASRMPKSPAFIRFFEKKEEQTAMEQQKTNVGNVARKRIKDSFKRPKNKFEFREDVEQFEKEADILLIREQLDELNDWNYASKRKTPGNRQRCKKMLSKQMREERQIARRDKAA